MTAAQTAQSVRRGEIAARAATEAALARMDAANPALNAVPHRDDAAALAAADAVDAAVAKGDDPGPLAGVPVTVKINVDQKGCATTNGLRLQENLIAEQDSPVVANLRRAGAVIVGRTNVPAFSIRWFTRNGLHGATKNPRNHGLTPGGSSGGAAAAVAAGIGAIGHGTDIAGSVRYPAYACGVHGLRPSLGRVAAANFSGPDRHIGAQLMAVSGPLARSMQDLRLALEAMAAPDIRDPWWTPAPLQGPPAQRRVALCLRPEGMTVDPTVVAALEQAADSFRAAGWTVETPALPPLQEAVSLQLMLWMAEFRRGAEDMVKREADADALFVYEQLCRHAPDPDLNGLLDALQRRATLTRAWRVFFEDYPLLLCPVSGLPPFADHRDVASREDFDAVFEAQATQIGLPFMGLPGLSVATRWDDAPMGVQLIASHFREDLLLAAGEALTGGAAVPPAA
jgi:amidase